MPSGPLCTQRAWYRCTVQCIIVGAYKCASTLYKCSNCSVLKIGRILSNLEPQQISSIAYEYNAYRLAIKIIKNIYNFFWYLALIIHSPKRVTFHPLKIGEIVKICQVYIEIF